MRQPEGLVIHEELDDFAVGHIANGLASLRESISAFPVYDRPRFVEAIDQGTVFRIGAAFLRAPAHAKVAVAERQHGFHLGQEFQAKPRFDDVPLVGREITRWRPEGFMTDHRAVFSRDSVKLW